MAAKIDTDFLLRETEWLLKKQPLLSYAPFVDNTIVVQGDYHFNGRHEGGIVIDEVFQLKFVFDITSPYFKPIVYEKSTVIPRDNHHHINSDNSLCLGSEIELFLLLRKNPSMKYFIENILDPFIYKAMLKVKGIESEFIGGELSHGDDGILESFRDLLKLKSVDEAHQAIELICMKKRLANKKNCPCQCGKRLGKCRLHIKINELRSLMPRSRFRKLFAPSKLRREG